MIAMSGERPPKRLCSSDVRKMIENWADAEEYGILSENSDSDPISHLDLDLDLDLVPVILMVTIASPTWLDLELGVRRKTDRPTYFQYILVL